MDLWDKLLAFKVYAVRGYVSLVGWIITIGTFAMVFYADMIEVFPFLVGVFPNSFVFMGISIPIGLLVLAKLGKWDYQKGTFPKEGATSFLNNPEWVKMQKKLDVLQADNEVLKRDINEIKRLLKN